jgi:hypothetical protein
LGTPSAPIARQARRRVKQLKTKMRHVRQVKSDFYTYAL